MPPVFGLIQELGEVSDDEMHEVFNMGCGFCCVVAADDEAAALELLRGTTRRKADRRAPPTAAGAGRSER